MVVRITIVVIAMVLLDLDDGFEALRTEGRLVPSGATGNNTRHQSRWIGLYHLAQHLG